MRHPPASATRFAASVVFLAALAVFARTAYPTITWWDSSSYSLAAATLGVGTPPGSLLLTVAGWVVTRLPFAPAHLLNLFAGALAATAAALVCVIATRLFRLAGAASDTGAHERAEPGFSAPSSTPGPAAAHAAGAALGAITLAFGATLWQYAIQFTPYVLTAVFTGLILLAMLRWWERADQRDAWRWLALLGVLFGLDFSVHRTNLLLLPALLVWILVRHPRTLRSPRAWGGGAGGMIAGLAFQLLLMPIAASNPVLNAGDPSSWSRFYDYVSLAQYGGGFLVSFYPRHAPFWSVQVMDLVRAFSANFLSITGKAGVLGVLPAVFGVVGLRSLWRRDRRLAIAIKALLCLQFIATVAYFNIPANFFRSFDRHYLPVFVTWGVLMAYGMGVALGHLAFVRLPGWRAVGIAMLLMLAPVSQLARNWESNDASRRFFTDDYATNLLNGLPRNAIVFTFGDNDTWPLVYEHVTARVRPDVEIVNLSLVNTGWYVEQIIRRDPAFPLSVAEQDTLGLQPRPWPDTTIAIPVEGSPSDFGLPDDVTLPDSIAVHAEPRLSGKYVLRQDLVQLLIFENSRWRRPVAFATTGGERGFLWYQPYGRMDGLFWRIVPYRDPPASIAILRRNLLKTYSYRGYADSTVLLDDIARRMGLGYYVPLVALAQAEARQGDLAGCRATREAMLRALPFSRLDPDPDTRQTIGALCAERSPTSPR